MSIESMYNLTASYQTPTYAEDSYGERVRTWGTSISFKCAFQGRSGSNSIVNEQEKARANYRLYCSSTVAITATSLVTVDSVEYDVLFVNNNIRGNHKQIDMQISSKP